MYAPSCVCVCVCDVRTASVVGHKNHIIHSVAKQTPYNTQIYCVFGLYPSSGILETRKHDVSETRSVSVLR
jgi:hypothetical protein